jgi:MoxR-like ATPase
MTAPPLIFTNDPTKTTTRRHADCPAEKEPYVAEEPLVEAVNLAIYLRRPLLLEGEAGCGKTRLARAVAHELGLPYYVWPIRSTSKVLEGLYTYDAIRRLHDVQVLRARPTGAWKFWSLPGAAHGGAGVARDPSDPKGYREFGALGRAFLQCDCPAVVLIDEIDKADIDFPNDLLTILDKPWEFHVAETDESVRAHPDCLPIVFVTSNKEKGNLPAPFLRRCLYHFVEFPEDVGRLRAIVLSHFPHLAEGEPAELVRVALERFREQRLRTDLYKRPGTSELLDWLAAVFGFRGQTVPLDRLADRARSLPFPEVLYKVKADFPRRARAATP